MNYVDVEKDEKKIEKIEKFFTDQVYYNNCYRKRRHEQIEKAKAEARKEKRREQSREKREQLAKDKASISLLKELVKDDYEMMQ